MSEPPVMEPCRPQVSTLAFLTKTFSPSQPKGVDKEGSIAFAVTGWGLEAAVQEFRASRGVMWELTDFADRYCCSSQLRRVGRNSNFTHSALPDRTELENLEVSATLRMEALSRGICS